METRQGRLCSRPPGSEGRGGGASDLTQKLSLPWDPSEGRKPLTPPRSRPSSEGYALLTTPPPMVSFSSCPRTSLSRAGPREVRSGTQQNGQGARLRFSHGPKGNPARSKIPGKIHGSLRPGGPAAPANGRARRRGG